MGAPSSDSKDNSASGSSSRAFKNPRQSGRKRGKGGKQTGRADFERMKENNKREGGSGDWRDFKRRKVNGGEDGASKNPFSKEEIEAEQKRPKRKVAVMVGYSGTGYRGMQINGDEPTIERDLFQAFIAAGAISKANADDHRKSSLIRCARTDKGVHAAGNIISLKLIIEDEDIVDKINDALPEQIRIWGIQRTNNSFNCYHECDSRWYEYLMPSYTLLPPSPRSFLGQSVQEYAKLHNVEADLEEKFADVKDFWSDVEENGVKPILERLDPEIRAKALERISSEDFDLVNEKGESKPEAAENNAAATEGAEKATSEEQTTTTASGEGAEVPEGSLKPKKRELGPLDYALRDIKMAYVSAKRKYRVSPERLQRLQEILTKYEGTHNFHNFTVQKAFKDPSAKRHIKSFVVNPEPIIIGDTEWLSLKVHGQSFMMHQIRKMVSLAVLMVRCGTPLDRVRESYLEQKMAIPKVPGLGLLLERPVFEMYNRKARDSLGKETLDFGKYEERLEAFKRKHIYNRIFDVEEKENAFHSFFNQVDQFKQNHFLWVTAGGMAVAKIAAQGQAEADKQLGDEDEEDVEGGEG
ncbi:unnamed protein product [Clonostachys rosea]|uniref:Pseudouridine synthase I TruA alpha/beta domain-containing protein n=1 Tax=Bionectria ochroleuca TaxID=29856 RepID=A0ABY6TR49_BIOOC|nr:unnamed protein product [Clonostachys rosea]